MKLIRLLAVVASVMTLPTTSASASPDERSAHWAWQALSKQGETSGYDGGDENPIDRFVRARLAERSLTLSVEADRPTLIRRLSFDLHGLPPAPEDVGAFLSDANPGAYDRLVDRMLDSSHLGERFAQHWLDIAHYADTHGFERDRRRDHAWRYRDYVIQAINEDKPYYRFLQEQIAGDVMWPDDDQAIVATGFLAAGPWDFVGQEEAKNPALKRAARSLDLDDMTTQVMTATMAMTINCARCHDHKIDPISQMEYYRLRAVFAGVKRADRSIGETAIEELEIERRSLQDEMHLLDQSLDLADIVGGGDGSGTGTARQGISANTGKVTTRASGFLNGARPNRFSPSDNSFIDGVFIPMCDDEKAEVTISSTGIAATGIPASDGKAWDVIRNGPVNQQHSPELGGIDYTRGGNTLLGLHANAGITFDLRALREKLGDVALRFTSRIGYFGAAASQNYADALVFVDGKKRAEYLRLKRADGSKIIDLTIPRSAKFLTLVSTGGGNGISMDQIGFGNPKLRSHAARLSPAESNRLIEIRNRVLQIDVKLSVLGKPQVYAVRPLNEMPAVRILRRGDAESPVGSPLEPGALTAMTMLQPELGTLASDQGERRAALARWITDPQNPLTPRVIVNRLWHWHFGQGIVVTPSDFGLGGGRPSHPKLLDWLAAELFRQKGSLKALHRIILTSATYKQDSRYAENAAGISIDAGNRLLWRQNARRIEAEAVRDSVLLVSGKLNRQSGGPGFEDFKYTEAYAPEYRYITADKPALWRRSIYRYIVRTTPNRFLTTLDCPDPANFTPRRLTTITPLQALVLQNNDFMLKQARYFAARIGEEAGTLTADQVTKAFECAFGRPPTAKESRLASQFVSEQGLFKLCHALFNANEFVHVD